MGVGAVVGVADGGEVREGAKVGIANGGREVCTKVGGAGSVDVGVGPIQAAKLMANTASKIKPYGIRLSAVIVVPVFIVYLLGFINSSPTL